MQIYSESVFAKAAAAAKLILASTESARINYFGPPPQPSALISCLIRLLSIFALLMQHTHSRSRRRESRGVDLFDLQKILQAGAHFSTLLRMIWPLLALAVQFMLLKIEPIEPFSPPRDKTAYKHTGLSVFLSRNCRRATTSSQYFLHKNPLRGLSQGRRGPPREKERDIAALFHQSHPLFALFHLKAHHEMAIYRFAQCARLKSTLCEC